MERLQISELAKALFDASQTGVSAALPGTCHPDITVADAYNIQSSLIEHHLKAGRALTGRKLALTGSEAQRKYGTDEPVIGYLMGHLGYSNGAAIPWGAIPCPKIECELAFVLGDDLLRPPSSADEALAAVAYAVPALELVGSRYGAYNAKLEDMIADNAFFGGYVLGDCPAELGRLDLEMLGLRLEVKGQMLGSGIGAAVMGSPANALLWLARRCCAQGAPLRAGEIILTGAFLPGKEAHEGDYFRASFDGLGDVSVRF